MSGDWEVVQSGNGWVERRTTMSREEFERFKSSCAPDTEVTPEMIEAGEAARLLPTVDPEYTTSAEDLTAIYRAMRALEPK